LVASPLIKRGVSIRCAYIWGGNLEISARGNGTQGSQNVDAVVQAYLDDPLNQANLTGDEAQERLERALASDGNVFLANFTRPLTGVVQTRVLPYDEIEEIYTNPEDSSEPWYYLRVYHTTTFLGGVEVSQERKVLYPALSYYPRTRPRRLRGGRLRPDARGLPHRLGDPREVAEPVRLAPDQVGRHEGRQRAAPEAPAHRPAPARQRLDRRGDPHGVRGHQAGGHPQDGGDRRRRLGPAPRRDGGLGPRPDQDGRHERRNPAAPEAPAHRPAPARQRLDRRGDPHGVRGHQAGGHPQDGGDRRRRLGPAPRRDGGLGPRHPGHHAAGR